MYGYYNYYTVPATTISSGTIVAIVVGIAALIGFILFFTLFRKKNEGKFKGFMGKVYNFFHFNRFYTEDIVKLLYVMTVFGVTFAGIAYIVMGAVKTGIVWIVGGNIAARLVSELTIICMIAVRRIVSMDRRLSNLEKFFEDDYSDWECGKSGEIVEDEDEDEGFQCSGSCSDCGYDCAPDVKASVIYAGHVEKEKLSAPQRSSDEDTETPRVSLKKNDEEADRQNDVTQTSAPEFCKGCEEWDEVSSDCYAENCVREKK